MANTLVQLYIHVMFHVKSTSVPMRPEDLSRVFSYISGGVRGMGSTAIAIGGMTDHVHILASLPKTLSVSSFVGGIKSQSSKWIKTVDAEAYQAFAWQDGYGAFSVSSSILERVQYYVMNQAAHHTAKKISYEEEYKEWLERYHVEYDEKYAFAY